MYRLVFILVTFWSQLVSLGDLIHSPTFYDLWSTV